MKIDVSETMIVMEHTGLYGYLFEQFLHSLKISFCKISAREILRSSGLVRGKTDKVDAARIALYGKQFYDKLRPIEHVSEHVNQLRFLHATRDRLVKQKASLLCSMEEYKNIGLKAANPVMRSQSRILKALEKEIERLNDAIEKTVSADEEVKKNITLLKSVIGVGDVVAVATVIKTENFKKFNNARKFSCFCGTAPFEHRSGTSIRGKTRVSHLADKSMKSLLDLAAKSAIMHDPELKAFYQRKTQEGKPKMSTINVVRNKIIYRMFAVIKRGTPYQKIVA